MQPSAERERRRDNQQAPNPRDRVKVTVVGGHAKRLRTASLGWEPEPDEWKKRLANIGKISPGVENKPLVDVLRSSELEYEEIAWFMRPSTTSARWERCVLDVERFCAGAEFALSNTIPADSENPELLEAQEPEAWVSDRDWFDGGDLATTSPSYPRILDNNKLYQALQKKRFPEGSHGDSVGPPRRIYVRNPNGASVAAIIRTTPATQVEGLRDLFAGYITPTPEPNFILRESDWWGGCFVVSFNIPYYGISTRKLQDYRTISNSGKRLRNRHDLDFLHLKYHWTSEDKEPSFHDNAVLHEAVYSLTVTVKSDKYWTAACLDDDVFGEELGEEPRLASDEEEGESDPILLKAEGNLIKSPRAYAIAALQMALYKITQHHWNVQEWLQASIFLHTSDTEDDSREKISTKELQNWIVKFPIVLSRMAYSTSKLVRKLDQFLDEDIIFGTDGLPQGILWQSLQTDLDALRSLQIIKQHRDKLRDIRTELEHLETAYEGVRQKIKNENEGEQQILAKQVHRIGIAAFIFAIPNTVAQLYSAMPESGFSTSWASYAAMVMVCVLMSAAVIMYLSGQYWQRVRRWFERVDASLPGTARALRRQA